jgi:hypothetical protein
MTRYTSMQADDGYHRASDWQGFRISQETLTTMDWVLNCAPTDGEVPGLELAKCGGKKRTQ